ncbi:uncharacterized protein FA14DRAFT_184859 [Meira miltonrushii]|uniref:Ribosomal RNA-processing protein 36 n=1 Tax=Meira miltonrushii TaxID=1280837 RepID=A0A316VFV8_9BASI|nr:uncharacterized protein FA14DRAFT_184859 [Meira miltonrushii]PWN36204.1 hypothetical protein FA14DRAFT_184859 [Meira miltonrushii]
MHLRHIVFLLIRPSFSASPPRDTAQNSADHTIDLELRLALPASSQTANVPQHSTSTHIISPTRSRPKKKSEAERGASKGSIEEAVGITRSETSLTDAHPMTQPSNQVHSETEAAIAASPMHKNQLPTEVLSITPFLVGTQQKNANTKRKPSEKYRQKKLLKQKLKRQRLKEEGGEVQEAFQVKERGYAKKARSKLRNDPVKLEEYRKYHRLAARRNYQEKKKDPVAFAAFIKMKSERSTKRKQMLRAKNRDPS